MKMRLLKASELGFEKEVDIKTIEDLENIYKKYGYELIVNFEDGIITIYDDYIE